MPLIRINMLGITDLQANRLLVSMKKESYATSSEETALSSNK